MPTFPSSIATVRTDWLTQVLRKHGCLRAAQVTAITAQPIGAEFGFLDSLARLNLSYDFPEPAAPDSVVVKISSAEETYRRIGNFYRAYEREFCFYESVATRSPIRLPRCWGREADAETGAHVLILEDLSSLTPGDQVCGLTPLQAKATLETIGQFHAHWWESPELDSFDWMPNRNIQPARFRAAWPKCRATFAAQLPESAIVLGDELNERLESLLAEVERRPHTIVHSDFRADNLLFDPASRTQPVVVLDWQLAIRSQGVLDVARLLCGSLSPHDRAACEMGLLQRWHESLLQGGVQNYSFVQALQAYRTAALICLYYPVTIHEAEEAAGRRGAALAQAQIERFFVAAVELAATR